MSKCDTIYTIMTAVQHKNILFTYKIHSMGHCMKFSCFSWNILIKISFYLKYGYVNVYIEIQRMSFKSIIQCTYIVCKTCGYLWFSKDIESNSDIYIRTLILWCDFDTLTKFKPRYKAEVDEEVRFGTHILHPLYTAEYEYPGQCWYSWYQFILCNFIYNLLISLGFFK